MWVMRTDHKSMKVPIEVCKKNNTDLDGDEDWGCVPASEDAIEETIAAGTESILEQVTVIVSVAGGDPSIDPTMYSTMPLEDMATHPGGRLYELLMLKPSV